MPVSVRIFGFGGAPELDKKNAFLTLMREAFPFTLHPDFISIRYMAEHSGPSRGIEVEVCLKEACRQDDSFRDNLAGSIAKFFLEQYPWASDGLEVSVKNSEGTRGKGYWSI